jgi:hypothetical protein
MFVELDTQDQVRAAHEALLDGRRRAFPADHAPPMTRCSSARRADLPVHAPAVLQSEARDPPERPCDALRPRSPIGERGRSLIRCLSRGGRSLLEAVVAELLGVQGSPADIGGYYRPEDEKAFAVMRPSATLNAAASSESAVCCARAWAQYRAK